MYTKHLSEPFFSSIKAGEKDVEGRIDDGDWSKMNMGDVITFWRSNKELGFANALPEDIIKCKIIDIVEVASFEELYIMFGSRLLPNVNNVAEAINVYIKSAENPEGLFTKVMEQTYGVVGFQLEVLL